jgi:hypothetical protein
MGLMDDLCALTLVFIGTLGFFFAPKQLYICVSRNLPFQEIAWFSDKAIFSSFEFLPIVGLPCQADVSL